MHDNALGGDDSVTVGDVGAYQVMANGGAGSDTLTGGPASEAFLGGSGNDTINPGGGIDVVDAGAGDDQVNVRDKTADVARGGDGNDSVTADPDELDILDGFENVDRTPDDVPPAAAPPAVVPPVVTPPVGPSQAGASVVPVTIRGGTSKVRRNTTSIKLSCPATSPGNCTGSLVVRTATKARLAGRRAVVQLGTARYDIAAGSSKTLKVKLARGTQRLADRHGRLAVRVVASTAASGQTATSSRRLTLALGTRSRKH
jgi:Ca2+-binding RTX toxin-like protein